MTILLTSDERTGENSKLETKEKVQMLCSTGIACESYGAIAKTVHSQYGLRVAELPSKLLIESSLGQNVTVKQVADTMVQRTWTLGTKYPC